MELESGPCLTGSHNDPAGGAHEFYAYDSDTHLVSTFSTTAKAFMSLVVIFLKRGMVFLFQFQFLFT